MALCATTICLPWWRHQMETFSALLALCEGNPLVTGGFQRPVMRSFDGFFDLRLNKRLNKQSKHRWFETPSRSLWRHCNACIVLGCTYTISAVFSCDQAALIWALLSVRPSVCLSVCHTFFTMFLSSYHREISRSYYYWQKLRPCKSSRSEVKDQGHRGQNPT